MKIYTRGGDDGSTALFGGARVAKDDPRVEAYGSVDELNAVLGVLRTEPLPDDAGERLAEVQSALLTIGGMLADPERRVGYDEKALDPAGLEAWIDLMDEELEPLSQFILPGGIRAAAWSHLARTVCRRAERRVRALAEGGAEVAAVLPYLNRLSDALFTLARLINARAGVPDPEWTPPRA